MEHDEIYEANFQDKKNESLPYLKNVVLSIAFSYARYSEGMKELTGSGMKNNLTLPSSANKYFNSIKDENDEPIYTYNDEYMRHFMKQSIKVGRCGSCNQYFKSTISDEVFNTLSEELIVNGDVSEIIDKYFEYTSKHRKILETEYDSQFDDYRDINQERRTKHIDNKLCKITKHINLQKLNDVLLDFGATSLYPSAMWNENSLYPKIETGFASKPHMNNIYVEAFNNQTFNQDGKESAVLQIKYYNPPNLISQHLPVKEKVNTIEVNRMRNRYIIDTLTSVDIQEIVKIGGKVIEIYAGVIYQENFKISPFRKVIEKLFAQGQKEDGHNGLMQSLVKLIMNSLCGVQIRRDIDQSNKCKSEHWMQTEYDENVSDYWKSPNGNYIAKMKNDDGLDGDNNVKNTLPSHLGAFISSNSKRNMNIFIREINVFYNISIYYGDTDSLYIDKNYWDVLDKAILVGKNLLQGKNEYKSGGIFYGLILAPKIKYVLTIDEFCIFQQHMTCKSFNDKKRLLDRS